MESSHTATILVFPNACGERRQPFEPIGTIIERVLATEFGSTPRFAVVEECWPGLELPSALQPGQRHTAWLGRGGHAVDG